MQGNRRSGTRPEQAVASELHRRGLRFRRDLYWKDADRDVRTHIDIAFTSRRCAAYVDGCRWHLCPEHSKTPKTNAGYWVPKLARNVERDRRVDAALRAAGWTVIRIWEHDDPVAAADRIEAIVRSV